MLVASTMFYNGKVLEDDCNFTMRFSFGLEEILLFNLLLQVGYKFYY